MAQQTTTHRREALFATSTTPVLIASAMMLDALTSRTESERLTLAWVCDEIARRHPEVEPALQAWADSLDEDGPTYAETLLVALPASVLA